ncbi:hypothetical protein ACOMHN_048267 [Nucella lapillus]
MSPFSHGKFIVVVIVCGLLCGGASGQPTGNEGAADRPGASIPPPLPARLSRQQDDGARPGGGRGVLSRQQGNGARPGGGRGVLSTGPRDTLGKGDEGGGVWGANTGLDGRRVNMTQVLAFLHQQQAQRHRRRDAQWAYMCVVGVVCVMVWAMWCQGGLQRCRYRSHPPTAFADSQPLVSVHEAVRRQSQYLPMCAEPQSWEEVVVCDRGTDP